MATFNEFCKECELYEYSQENFDLMRECSELRLMAEYVERLDYMAENVEMFDEASEILMESYLCECEVFEEGGDLADKLTELSGKANTLADKSMAIKVKGSAKAANILNTIWTKMKKIFRTVVNFFKKLFSRNDATNRKCKQLLDLMHDNATPENVDKFSKVINSAFTKYYNNGGNDFNFKAIGVPEANKFLNQLPKDQRDFVAAALSSKAVTATANKADIEIVSLEDLAEAAKAYGDSMVYKNNKSMLSAKSIVASLEKSVESARKRGITIDVSDKKLKDAIERLETIVSYFDDPDIKDRNGEERNLMRTTSAKSGDNFGMAISDLVDANTKLQNKIIKIAPNVLNVYNRYDQARKTIIDNGLSIFGGSDDSND